MERTMMTAAEFAALPLDDFDPDERDTIALLYGCQEIDNLGSWPWGLERDLLARLSEYIRAHPEEFVAASYGV